jgi:hypothetical protein
MSIGTPYTNSAKNLWEFLEPFVNVILVILELFP